ncbi:MAG: hypothetical protein ACRD1P_07670 [Thermoanaerobaculia bacterium]
MGSGSSPVRVVLPHAGRRRRSPGPAVLFILLYALLFAAALWSLGARTRPLGGRGATSAAAPGVACAAAFKPSGPPR